MFELLAFGLGISLLSRQESPIRVAISEAVAITEFEADGFLSFDELECLVESPPCPKNEGLVAVGVLKAVAITQFEADGFLFLMQVECLVESPPCLKDERLVPVASLKSVAIVESEADGFLSVLRKFEGWETDWRSCAEEMADFQAAFGWLLTQAGEKFRPAARALWASSSATC